MKTQRNKPLNGEKRTPEPAAVVIPGGDYMLGTAQQRTPLRSLDDVKRELGRLYRGVKAGVIASDEGSRRAYILSTLGKVIEAADLEKRLAVLEQQRLLPPPN
jgi:hypothetical protein